MPCLSTADFWHVARPFIHQDRIMDVHVFDYIVKGGMYIIEDGTEYRLTPGSFLFLKQGLHHWGHELCEPDTEWYYFHFFLPQDSTYPEHNDKVPAFSPRNYEPEDYRYSAALPKYLEIRESDDRRRLEDMLGILVQDFHSADSLGSLHMNLQLSAILTECRRMSMSADGPVYGNAYVRKAGDYLREHCAEQLDTMDLASRLHLNYRYLESLYRRETGLTILEYHTKLRMDRAERFLRETEIPVGDISALLGYSDQFYFSNVFKKTYGLSPRDYRRTIPMSI